MYATPGIDLRIKVTDRVVGTVVVCESGEWYRRERTL